jgi:hypothetical protein
MFRDASGGVGIARPSRPHPLCPGLEHGSGPAPNRVRQPRSSAITQPGEDSACVRPYWTT